MMSNPIPASINALRSRGRSVPRTTRLGRRRKRLGDQGAHRSSRRHNRDGGTCLPHRHLAEQYPASSMALAVQTCPNWVAIKTWHAPDQRLRQSLAARSRNRKKRDTMCASAACSIRTRSRKDERGVFRGRERARLGHLSEMARCGVGGHTAIKKSIRQRSKQVQFDFYLGGYPEPSNQRICAKNRGFHPVISKAKARNVFRVAPDSRSSPTPTSQILATLSLNETTGAHIRGPGGM